MKDYLGYKDKVCVVTGAASGMGRAICEDLLHLGAKVYGLDIAAPKNSEINYVNVDLGRKESIDKAFELLPQKIDRLFLAAGIAADERFSFETVVNVNFTSNKYILDSYVPQRMGKNGAVAVISSMAGACWKEYLSEYIDVADAGSWEEAESQLEKLRKDFVADGVSYVFAKRAVVYYAMKKVKEFGEKGIRINALLPGSTLTPMTERMIEQGLKEELLKTDGVAGRLAEVREMAEPTLFLNSEMASFLTGNILFGDFGFYMMDYVGTKSNDHYYDFPTLNRG